MISNLLLVSLSMNLCENKTRDASHKTAKDKIVETRLTFKPSFWNIGISHIGNSLENSSYD
mgnify:CR=1 FL=1